MVQVPESPGAYKLQKNGVVIYVGSALNLKQRFSDWKNNPENPCVRQNGWDTFVWQKTNTHNEARDLELVWYSNINPVCNVNRPPGR